jgi:hypothetical protein
MDLDPLMIQAIEAPVYTDEDVVNMRAELEAYRSGIRSICDVARQAAAGNLEPRILGLTHDGPLRCLCSRVKRVARPRVGRKVLSPCARARAGRHLSQRRDSHE